MKSVPKTIVNILAWIVLILALLVTLVVFSSGRNNGVANLFGFIPLTVESDSMKPTFKKGDLIICKEVEDINKLEKGDVITFWTIIDGKKVKNTHRIVEINQAENSRSFVTRGDNNNLEDDMPAYAGDVIGEWTNFKFGSAGKAMNFLRTKTGFFVCIVIPMAIFFLIELYKFIVTVQEVRKPALTSDDEEEIKRRAIEEYLASQKAQQGETAQAETTAPAAEKAQEAPAAPAAETAAPAPAPETPAVPVDAVAEKAEETVTEAAESAAETVEETVTEAAESAAETVDETVTDAADSVAETVDETVTEAAESAAETVEETVTEAAESAAETVDETVTDAADSVAETVDETVTEAADSVAETVDETVKSEESDSAE